jgi:membrane-associated phospholipid phosphatase
LVAIPYLITNNIAHLYLDTVIDPELALDRKIPVVYWMILPYSLLYLFYPVTLVLSPRDDRGRAELVVAMQMLIAVNAVCCINHLILPAEIDLRDQIDWELMNYWQTSLFEFIHSADNPWNAWPSLHIVHSYFLARLMTMWVQRENPDHTLTKPFLFLLWLEWGLLCISILATKQHYAFDLVTGFLVGHLAWVWCKPGLDLVGSKGSEAFAEGAGWA